MLTTVAELEPSLVIREIRLSDLTVHMILAENVMGTDGALVVGKGQEVTSSLCDRLKNFARKRTIKEPIRVFVQAEAGAGVVRHSAPA